MSLLTIQVATPSGAPQSYSIESDCVRIGTAAHCEVRLPIGDAAAVHVTLEVRGDREIYAEATSLQPAPVIDGKPFSVAKLLPSAVLEIGQTRIRACVAEPRSADRAKKKAKSSALIRVAAAVGIPLAIWQIASEPPDELPNAPRKAPELFAVAPASCPQAGAESASAYGLEQARLGDAKRQRRLFHAHDGVQAVGLYRVGAACMRSGGDAASARDLDAQADVLQREIESDYRTHRVRLEHALSVHERATAREEVQALRDLTTGQSGDYVTWLSNLGRRMQMGRQEGGRQESAGAAP
jgi:hypothetical protein